MKMKDILTLAFTILFLLSFMANCIFILKMDDKTTENIDGTFYTSKAGTTVILNESVMEKMFGNAWNYQQLFERPRILDGGITKAYFGAIGYKAPYYKGEKKAVYDIYSLEKNILWTISIDFQHKVLSIEGPTHVEQKINMLDNGYLEFLGKPE